MFCLITASMLMTSISVANLPCSEFASIEPQVNDKVASLDPSFVPAPTPPKAMKTEPILPDPKHTAIYDISARAVILPSGEKLEAHSGLGERLDDPDAVKAKARGPTPPNHYKLTLREHLFHGIRAIRLNPVYEDKMFGRDGILAHPYMLGGKGESFGCVSVLNYDKFLKQYLTGKITDLVVVRTKAEAKRYALSEAR